VKIFPVVKKTTVVSGSGPTFIIKDYAGATDKITQAWTLPESAGAADSAMTWANTRFDNVGASDALTLTGTPVYQDKVGASDSELLQVDEKAQVSISTPDTAAWGDSYVNRTVAQAGNNFSANNYWEVAAGTAATQEDAYVEIDFTRFAGLSAGVGSSYLRFTFTWQAVGLTPSQTLLVDMRSNASRPFVESTITANNHARFASSSPYSQRSVAHLMDGTQYSVDVILTSAEINNLVGKWLEVQFSTPDLSLGTLLGVSRRGSLSLIPAYRLFLAK